MAESVTFGNYVRDVAGTLRLPGGVKEHAAGFYGSLAGQGFITPAFDAAGRAAMERAMAFGHRAGASPS